MCQCLMYASFHVIFESVGFFFLTLTKYASKIARPFLAALYPLGAGHITLPRLCVVMWIVSRILCASENDALQLK